MWPFTKTSRAPVEETPFEAEYRAQVAAVKAWRSIGETFMYLGRTMRVESYWTPCFLCLPGIRAHYLDDNGVIRSQQFTREEIEVLMREQPGPAGGAG